MKRMASFLALLLLLGLGPAGAEKSVETQKQQPPEILVSAGTSLQVRLDQTLDTARNRAGDRFTVTLNAPVVIGGKVVIPRRTRFRGQVTGAKPSGRLKGRGYLTATLDSFTMGGKTYRITTSASSRITEAHKKRNLAWIGGTSGGGALIGGLAAGGPWALAGAGIGAGAGTATAALTGKKNVSIPVETVMTFTLKAPVQVRRQP